MSRQRCMGWWSGGAARTLAFALALGAIGGVSVRADTIHVPEDYPTIQEGIDAAVNGDEVVVADGIWTGDDTRDLDFGGRLIMVRSASGDPSLCVIDCEGSEKDPHRGFIFENLETAAATVEGFTITGGYADLGGGIFVFVSDPTIVNCRFSGNDAEQGGGLYCGGSALSLIGCTFVDNAASLGGGFYSAVGAPTVTECTFDGNSAEHGAGMHNFLSRTVATSCTFVENTALRVERQALGGGMYNESSDPVVTGCAFSGNRAEYGGGIFNDTSGAPLFAACTLDGNTTTIRGGGLYSDDPDTATTIVGCVFTGNSSPSGGAAFVDRSTDLFVGCIFAGNDAEGRGGALISQFGASTTIVNCLFSGNTTGGVGGAVVAVNAPSPLSVLNCTFSNNSAKIDGGAMTSFATDLTVSNCILWNDEPNEIVDHVGKANVRYCNVEGGFTGEGNVDVPPDFRDPDGEDNDPETWEDNDFRLAPGSPCIDAADNEVVSDGITEDLGGNPRFVDDPDTEDTGNGDPPIVDMGAYELQVDLCPADLDGSGAVDIGDILAILSAWGNKGGPEDLDGNGVVDFGDLLIVLAAWGPCEG